MKQLLSIILIFFSFISCKEKNDIPKPVQKSQKLELNINNIGKKFHLLTHNEKIIYLTGLLKNDYLNNTELDEWVLDKIVREPDILEKSKTKSLREFVNTIEKSSFKKSHRYSTKFIFEKRQDEKFKPLQALALKAILDELQSKSNKDSIKYYLDFYEKSISPDSDPIFKYDYFSKLSIYNELNGDIFKAILNLDKALTFLSDDDHSNKSILYNNLSLLYKSLNYYEKAEYYIEKAISVTNESDLQLNTLNTLAIIKMRLNKLEESEKVYNKVIEKNKKENNQIMIAQVYTNLGNVSRRKKEFDKALNYYHMSDSICDDLNVDIGKYINQINRSEVYLDKGDYKEAEKNILLAQKLSDNFDIPSYSIELYKLLSDILAKNNKTALSDKYFRMYIELKETLSGDQIKSSITEWELAKERENNLAFNSEIQLKMERQKNQLYFISLTLIIVLVSAIAFYFYQKQKKA